MTAGVHSRGRLRVPNEEAIMRDYVQLARALGFTDAALMDTAELVIVPEYRQFCEEISAAIITSCRSARR